MVYTVTFNPALDYIMHVNQWNSDDVSRSEREELCYGGKGINVSAVLKELGVPSLNLGFVAGFTGEELIRLMESDGLQSNFISLPEGHTRINVKVKADQEHDINAGGPAVGADQLVQLFDQLSQLKDGDALVLSGSVPANLPDDIYAQMMLRLQGKDVLILVDTTGAQLENCLKYKPFLIKPNRYELEELTGKELATTEDILFAAKELQEKGARNVLVSLGADGSVLLDETGAMHLAQPKPGTLLNSVGCGDSMVAGFLAATLNRPNDYAYALNLANACGTATAYSEGLATKLEIEAQLS